MKTSEPIVFVVDDDPSVRETLADLIASVGLSVLAFKSAREFLESRRPDAPACLVLDVRLPGLSGLDLQRELLRIEAPIPIRALETAAMPPRSTRICWTLISSCGSPVKICRQSSSRGN